jgi:hypothetical protein
MIYEFLKHPLVMMFVCAILVFAEMFLAKKWYTNLTKKIESAKARRGANLLLGIFTCLVLALSQMAALCDVFGIAWLWAYAIASAFIATFIYIALEKVFGESEVNEIGKTFCEVVSHSNKFDGNITHKGMVDIARKMLTVVHKIDDATAAKETKAIDDVVARLDSFLADGVVTEAEKAEAKKLVSDAGVDGNTLLAKYSSLLK